MKDKLKSLRKSIKSRILDLSTDTDTNTLNYKNVKVCSNNIVYIDDVKTKYELNGDTVLTITGQQELTFKLIHTFKDVNINIVSGEVVKNLDGAFKFLQDSTILIFLKDYIST